MQQAHEQIGTLLSQQSDAYKALQAQLGRQSQAEARAHDAIAERVHPSRTYADGCGRYLRLCCGHPPGNTMQQNNPPHRCGRRQWPSAVADVHDRALRTLSEQYARLESVPSEPNVGAVLRALQAALPALQAWAGTAASDSAGARERMAVAASEARHSRPNPA